MPKSKIPAPVSRNDHLHTLLLEATGLETSWTCDEKANPFGWLLLEQPEQLRDAAKALAGKVRLCTITAYAVARDDADKRRRVAYHFADGDTVITVTVPLFDPETNRKLAIPSITPWFRNADWNEREFREMFNIDIPDHPNPKRLFLDERLDAGIMTKLIPFSAMANSAGTNMLWERILEAKGVPVDERMPSVAAPAEPIKLEPKVTPVAAEEGPKPAPEKTPGSATLADMAMAPDEFKAARAKEKAAIQEGGTGAPEAPAQAPPQAAAESGPDGRTDAPPQAEAAAPESSGQAEAAKAQSPAAPEAASSLAGSAPEAQPEAPAVASEAVEAPAREVAEEMAEEAERPDTGETPPVQAAPLRADPPTAPRTAVSPKGPKAPGKTAPKTPSGKSKARK